MDGHVHTPHRFSPLIRSGWGTTNYPFKNGTCFGNLVSNIGSLSSWSYYMLDYSDTYNQPIGATAFVLDWPSNAVVGFVPLNISAPSTANSFHFPGATSVAPFIQQTATFNTPLALNPLKTYMLAFCANDSTNSHGYVFAVWQWWNSSSLLRSRLQCERSIMGQLSRKFLRVSHHVTAVLCLPGHHRHLLCGRRGSSQHHPIGSIVQPADRHLVDKDCSGSYTKYQHQKKVEQRYRFAFEMQLIFSLVAPSSKLP